MLKQQIDELSINRFNLLSKGKLNIRSDRDQIISQSLKCFDQVKMPLDEREPLLAEEQLEESNSDHLLPATNPKWSFLPRLDVDEPRFRFLPLVGCLIVLVNEGEFIFKEIGYFRALEALYCIEYYDTADPDIAAPAA